MVNQCNFIGHLGSSPEVKYSQSGDAIANVSLACSEKWKGADGQQQEKTEWIRIVAFKRLAEVMGEYLTKGSLVYISGKMQTRDWQDKDGNKRYTTEIVAREMQMLSPKSSAGGEHGQPDSVPDSEVPF